MRRDASRRRVAEVEIRHHEQPLLFDLQDHVGSGPLDLAVQRSDTTAEPVEHLDGEARVPPEPDQEAALGDHEEIGLRDGGHVRLSR